MYQGAQKIPHRNIPNAAHKISAKTFVMESHIWAMVDDMSERLSFIALMSPIWTLPEAEISRPGAYLLIISFMCLRMSSVESFKKACKVELTTDDTLLFWKNFRSFWIDSLSSSSSVVLPFFIHQEHALSTTAQASFVIFSANELRKRESILSLFIIDGNLSLNSLTRIDVIASVAPNNAIPLEIVKEGLSLSIFTFSIERPNASDISGRIKFILDAPPVKNTPLTVLPGIFVSLKSRSASIILSI